MAIQFFENDVGKKIDYTITDDMIIKYSEQFQKLTDFIRDHRATMKTWQQLAILEGQLPSKDPANPTVRELPPTDAAYFAIEWCVSPIHHGPVEDACGCGCGGG